MDGRRAAIGFLANADEVFGGNETACKTENDVECDEAPELKPGKRGAVHADPGRLTDDDVGFDGRLGWETPVKIINNGKRRAGERHEQEGEESPARPDEGKRHRDDEIQAAPANQYEGKRG